MCKICIIQSDSSLISCSRDGVGGEIVEGVVLGGVRSTTQASFNRELTAQQEG